MILQIIEFHSIQINWKELLCFYKNNDLIKPVQIRPNHRTIMIFNDYAKPSSSESTCGVSHLLNQNSYYDLLYDLVEFIFL